MVIHLEMGTALRRNNCKLSLCTDVTVVVGFSVTVVALTIIRQTAILGVVDKVVILELGIPSRFCKLERLGHQFRPIYDGGSEVADVDDVELLGKGPGFFAVVDFEFDVWWNPGLR